MVGISRRSIEEVKLDIKALERSVADPMEVMADLNRVTRKIMVDTIKAEHTGKNLSEEELVQIRGKIALLGRRDTSKP
jgi:hypothetical protein